MQLVFLADWHFIRYPGADFLHYFRLAVDVPRKSLIVLLTQSISDTVFWCTLFCPLFWGLQIILLSIFCFSFRTYFHQGLQEAYRSIV